MKSIALVVIRRVYWDRGRLARLKQQVHSNRGPQRGSRVGMEVTVEPVNSDEVAFNESGRDARGPSRSGPGIHLGRFRFQ